MISLQTYILILLAISGLSMYFIVGVLVKQVRLMKAPFVQADKYDEGTKKILVHFRNVLMFISITIILMGLIPVIINIYTFFIDSGRPETFSPISFIYSFAVHTQALMLAYLVSRLYRLADNQKTITDLTQKSLEKELRTVKDK